MYPAKPPAAAPAATRSTARWKASRATSSEGIDVIKNPKASITEGGLGGTINLKTIDPLSQPDGLSLAGNLRESKAQNTGSSTPDGTVVGSYKVNDRLAFTGTFTYDDEMTHTKEYQDQNRNGVAGHEFGDRPVYGSR